LAPAYDGLPSFSADAEFEIHGGWSGWFLPPGDAVGRSCRHADVLARIVVRRCRRGAHILPDGPPAAGAYCGV